MKKPYALSFLLFALAACSASANMNLNTFNDFEVDQTTTSQVVAEAGQPYSIKNKGDGVVEYEYIERIKAGGRDLEDRHYYITFKDGKVVHKKVVYGSPAPYLYDSYEMQTSQVNHLDPVDD